MAEEALIISWTHPQWQQTGEWSQNCMTQLSKASCSTK